MYKNVIRAIRELMAQLNEPIFRPVDNLNERKIASVSQPNFRPVDNLNERKIASVSQPNFRPAERKTALSENEELLNELNPSNFGLVNQSQNGAVAQLSAHKIVAANPENEQTETAPISLQSRFDGCRKVAILSQSFIILPFSYRNNAT